MTGRPLCTADDSPTLPGRRVERSTGPPRIDTARAGEAGAFDPRTSGTFLGPFAGPVVFTGLATTVRGGDEPLLFAAGVTAIAAVLTAVAVVERESERTGASRLPPHRVG